MSRFRRHINLFALFSATCFALCGFDLFVTFAHAQTESNRGLPSAGPQDPGKPVPPDQSKVWKELFENKAVSEITANDDQLAKFGQKGGYFQSAAKLFVGGYVAQGGLMTLGAEKTLQNVCSGGGSGGGAAKAGDDKQADFCKQKKDEVIKAWEAAGLVYGVPSGALMCIEAESKKDHKSEGAAPKENKEAGPKALTNEQKKALQPKFDIGCLKFKKMTGQGGGKDAAAGAKDGAKDSDEKCESKMSEAAGPAYEAAKGARTLLLELEPTLLKGGQGVTNADYFDLIKVLAIAKTGSEDEARAAGAKMPVKVPQQYQSFVDGVMKCMGAGAKNVGAPEDHTKGTQKQ